MKNRYFSVIVALAAFALAVFSNGCATQAASGGSARSDRLRESRLPGPARSASVADPLTPANFPEPASLPTAIRSPQAADEPDPHAVIDWLLNQKR